jgi:hypothetical protein
MLVLALGMTIRISVWSTFTDSVQKGFLLTTLIYKTYQIVCASENLTSKGWFPKAFIKRSSGDQQHRHAVFGGQGETYSTELLANAVASGLAKAWIDIQPQVEEPKESLTMNWTTDTPTLEGWYWFRMDTGDKRTVMVYVISADRMVAVGDERGGNPAAQKGFWFGPVEPPPFEEHRPI